jgi:negative regulator of flagellin synthesis FlgM
MAIIAAGGPEMPSRRQPMDISIKNQPIAIENYINPVNQPPKTEPANEAPREAQAAPADTVQISDSARQIREAQSRIRDIPDVREDKVSELKKMIAEGTYKVEPDKIASKMIEESLVNDLLG